MNRIAAAELQGRSVPLSKTARLMARHMDTAWSTPMFPVLMEVDLTAASARRADGASLSDVIVAACARTLREHPRLNAHYTDEGIVEYDDINVGLAVASEKGLTVPVIHGADRLSLAEIGERRRALVAKAREARLGIPEVMNGTFTVSNLGMFGVRQFTAILNPPQVAILAVGATNRRQIWNDGDPEWRPICELTLTSDHRAVDGARAAAFLGALKTRLEAGSSGE